MTVETNGAAASRILESDDAPRLAVLDWMMPGMEGVADLPADSRAQEPSVYLRLAADRAEREARPAARLELGADDYLTKPFDSEELRARLLVGERILALQDDLILASRRNCDSAPRTTMLTGISNRATVMDALRNELSRQVRERARSE